MDNQTHVTQHRTNDTKHGHKLLVICSRSLGGGEHSICNMGMVLGNRVNSQGPWEAGFVVLRGGGDPWCLKEAVIGLYNNFLSCQGAEVHYSGKSIIKLCLIPLMRKADGHSTLSTGAGVGG